MRMPLSMLFLLMSSVAVAQGLRKGTIIPLPSDMEFVVVDEEVRGPTRVFKMGDICKSSRNFDHAEYLKQTPYAVTAVFKRGAMSSRGDTCPHGATVTFKREELELIIREADDTFSREIFPNRK